MIVTIPGMLIDPEAETLDKMLARFGWARRRAHAAIHKGEPRVRIEKWLQIETGLNCRWVRSAISSIRALPKHTVFGGRRNLKLLQTGKITKDDWRKMRNSSLYSVGDGSKEGKGNVNARIVHLSDGYYLRLNTSGLSEERYLWAKLFIPSRFLEKWGYALSGDRSYSVLIKRANEGFDVRIAIHVDVPEPYAPKRALGLDINARHLDLASPDRDRIHVARVSGRFCESRNAWNRAAKKVVNIAKGLNAGLVVGDIKRLPRERVHGKKHGWRHRRPRRVLSQMPTYKLKRKLALECALKGVPISFVHEYGTSKRGEPLGRGLGLDTHKAAALLIALKPQTFESRRGVSAHDALDCMSGGLTGGRGLTAQFHRTVGFDEGLATGGYIPKADRDGPLLRVPKNVIWVKGIA